MSNSKTSQRGFAPILILLVVVVLAAGGFFLYQKMMMKSSPTVDMPSSYASPSPSSSTKAYTTDSNKIAQSSESAKVSTDTAVVADYLICPKYDEVGGVSYPPFPATGPAPLPVTLYGIGTDSNTVGDSLASYDWDFEGDGKWDANVKEQGVTNSYTKAGTYKPVFRLRSLSGKVSKNCVYPNPVTVDGGKATTDAISVNRSTANLTLSKGNPNAVLMSQDHASYMDGNLYGSAFNVSLLKANRWQLVDKDGSTDINFDISEKTGVVGESSRVHAVAPATLANGEYKTTAKLQYFMNSTWTTFATITLNVTVTD